ncbi:MAG: AzlD domain-containing protein [Alphaproteobacteria bacterium]
MEATRLLIIFIMGLLAFGMRVLPQIFFLGRTFPPAWDLFFRYLSYALICSIVSTTLFMAAGHFESQAAPHRAVALFATIVVAQRTRSAVTGMIIGATVVLLLLWMR